MLKKDDLIGVLLTNQVELSVLTPVRAFSGIHVGVGPSASGENLPPFTNVKYNKLTDGDRLPRITFSNIYDFMVQRERGDGGCVQNFKGLDKSVKHFDAGDIQNIELAKVRNIIKIYEIISEFYIFKVYIIFYSDHVRLLYTCAYSS